MIAIAITCDCLPDRGALELGDLAVMSDGTLKAHVGVGLTRERAIRRMDECVWISSKKTEGDDASVPANWRVAHVWCPRCKRHLQRNDVDMAQRIQQMWDAGITTVTLGALIAALA